VLAWLATAAGVLSIVSALTPEMADRVDLVNGVLPPGVLDAARTAVLALGLGLIWLSRGLARRKRRAWWLALAIVGASALAHIAKGLDFEESTAHLLLLAGLWRSRRHFVAPGDPATVRPLAQIGAALAVTVPVALVYAYDHDAFSERIVRPRRVVTASVRPSSFRRTVTTASPTSPCAVTRATSSPRVAARFSPTG
jgi:lysyl-tRNA synthetase class 2